MTEHRMKTETGVGIRTRAVAGMGTKTGTRTGLVRAEVRRKSARNRTRVVQSMWGTGKTWVESGDNVDKNMLVQ